MGEQRHNKINKKNIDKTVIAQVSLLCIFALIFMYLGYRLALNCVQLRSYGEVVATIIAFLLNLKIIEEGKKFVETKKFNAKTKKLLEKLIVAVKIIIWLFGLSFAFIYIFLIIFSKDVKKDVTVPVTGETIQTLEEPEDGQNFDAKPFVYHLDVLFSDLPYYLDGKKITNRESSIHEAIMKGMNCGDLPDRYEKNPDKLNVGLYAKYTNEANEYFLCYQAIEDRDIKEEDRLYFLSRARAKRKEADGVYVTTSNSWNLIWDCERMRTQLYLCIAEEDDEGKIEEWKAEANECNRDIMYAAWNILQIQYFQNKNFNEDALEKMIDAYKWEKDNMPEDGAYYDEIIDAFQNLHK